LHFFISFLLDFKIFFIIVLKMSNKILYPAGDGKVSFVDVRDIAAVSVQVLTSDN
jgi:uncharacterized protein YbjT (DUF2867 family)